jgi:tetratricopeptide (TPR) repeat protein
VSVLVRAAFIIAALLLLAAGARAESDVRARNSAPLWDELAHPGSRRAQALLRSAAYQEREAARLLPTDWPALCRRALVPGFGEETLATVRGRARALRELGRQALLRRARLDSALDRLERAAQLAPREPAIHYAQARVLLAWEEPVSPFRCASRRKDDQAIALLERLRREHPTFAPSAVAIDLAVALTRRARFADAARVYREAVALALAHSELSVMRGNLAEVTMLSGDLEGAIAEYERALRSAGPGRERLLPLWGLAVALDRMGEHDAALERARTALAADGGRMSVLRSDGVFFEPDHEIHYYEALGHEALAAGADTPASAEKSRGDAIASLRRFLAAAGPDAPFSSPAQANLARLQRR